MKVARYWARESAVGDDGAGRRLRLVSWSGSNESVAEAKQQASKKLEQWLIRLRAGQLRGGYPYHGNDAVREELIEETYDDDGKLIAAITRNRYGALVLNSAEVLFADVDLPVSAAKRGNPLAALLSWFTGRKADAHDARARDEYRERFAAFHDRHPDLALRVYETAAGFRLVILNKLFDPLSAETQTILERLDSDDLYIRLCRSQECFRARLTPKPWRCGVGNPPNRYPREDDREERRFVSWLKDYDSQIKDYRVCRLVDEYGRENIAEAAQTVVRIHDRYVLKPEHGSLA